MEFDWDERKRKSNWEKHKVDLLYAARMFETPDDVECFPDARHLGENRITALGKVEGVWHCLTYEDRGEICRLITAWKLNEKSKRKAQARLARRTARHARKG
jgi:hypothetical protein